MWGQPDNTPVQEKAEALEDRIFLGGPQRSFERIGRDQLVVLLENGLQPWSNVLDFGCGALRGGWWLMHFLHPGRYHGIEPDRERVEVALTEICGRWLIRRAKPMFSHNSDLDMSVFDVPWDYVIMRSVWTHSSKAEIGIMLDSFSETAAPRGRLITSVLPAGDRWPDYTEKAGLREGKEGMLAHDLDWIKAQAAQRGMGFKQLRPRYNQNQLWIRVDHPSQATE